MRYGFVKTIILLMLFSLSLPGKAQSMSLKKDTIVQARYKFENDSSLLNMLQRWTIISRYELTFIGQLELPLIPELKSIQAYSFQEAIEETLNAYRNYNLNVVMEVRLDQDKKHLYLSTKKLVEQAKVEQAKLQKPKESLDAGFDVSVNDKSIMQVFVRWATQIGYQSYINGQPVNLQVFPRHVSNYPDYSLINAVKTFKSQSNLKSAIGEFMAMYTGISLDPFTINVAETERRMYITGLVRN